MTSLEVSTRSDEDREIERARAGESAAFVALIRRYNQRIFRIARAILADDAEAEDVAQEAWVAAWHHLGQYAGRGSFGGWVGRIAARGALARCRQRSVGLRGQEADDRAEDPERGASRGEARHRIEAAIDALPDALRAVFVLRAVQELTVAETAECLETSEVLVRTRLHRARLLLRDALADEAGAARAFPFAGERCARITAAVLARVTQANGFTTRKAP